MMNSLISELSGAQTQKIQHEFATKVASVAKRQQMMDGINTLTLLDKATKPGNGVVTASKVDTYA